MIIPMKTISVLGLDSHSEGILARLRDLGVVHVKHVKPPEGASLDSLVEDVAKARVVLGAVPQDVTPQESLDNPKELLGKAFDAVEKIRSLNDEMAQLRREASKAEFLGSYHTKDVADLTEKGIHLRLFECTPKQMQGLKADCVLQEIAQREGKIVLAALSNQAPPELDIAEIPLPIRSASEIQALLQAKAGKLQELEKEIAGYGKFREAFSGAALELDEAREAEQVRAGLGEAEKVVYLKGFCPAPEADRLKQAAKENAWGLLIGDPGPDDEPPTMVKNPKWVQIVRPVFQMMGTTPGYREFDINMWFLLFFSVFFAMIIGDAGYGTVFVLATLWAHLKFGKKVKAKQVFYLMYVLGGSTILWGAMTGVWLGLDKIGQAVPFRYFVVPALDSFSDLSQSTVMGLCFVLALIQLCLGHLIAAIRVRKSPKVIAELAWIVLLTGIYFLARMLVLEIPMPGVASYMIGGGVLLVILFGNAEGSLKQTIKTTLSGLLPTVLGFVSAFADVISYIRLFAVGMAGLAVSVSFYEIAGQIGWNSVVSGFISALIMVVAHMLNIVLGLMSVMVHGLRLNMLEFSGHVGNTWSGYEYAPFKKRIET